MTDTVSCADCEAIFPDVIPQEREELSCPECGSTRVSFHMHVSSALSLYQSFVMKQKEPGTKKYIREQFDGGAYTRRTGKFSKKTRIIDRKNNWYFELVTDRDTGEVLHECAEPLTEHFGHGSAKVKHNKA